MSDLWSAVLTRLSGRIGPRSYRDWFEPTRLLGVEEGRLQVAVPNVLFQEWLDRNFRDVVEEVLTEIAGDPERTETGEPATPREVAFVVRGENDAAPPAFDAGGPPGATGPAPTDLLGDARARTTPLFAREDFGAARALRAPGAILNPRYTFDNFVVGACNQFAHAAARAVADAPGSSYNPLYLYGGVGLGKTHLMQAIGHALRESHGEQTLTYVSAERFMCEMINAIRWKCQPEFREKFRSIDVLIVDDIQFLEGKEATQEEFFHTFRTLYEDGKQIILSSDCPPRELATLEERLRSRFESGLLCDMQAPDLETKLAILRRKAESDGRPIPDDVALFIASRVRSNVRELEGCLTRILALASLRGVDIDMALAREAMRDIFPDEPKPISVERIQRCVADYYNVRVADLKARNNARAVAFPRQVAMYLCKKMTDSSFPDIGRRFGGKHHSTVIHSVNKIEGQLAESSELSSALDKLRNSLQ